MGDPVPDPNHKGIGMMATSTKSNETSTGTVARVTLLLRVLAEAEGEANLGDIAERMKLPVSTTHRLLNLLLEQGFVRRRPGSRVYGPGLEFLRVGGLVTSRSEVAEVAHGFMHAVVEACDETCMLSLYVPRQQASMIAKVIYGSHPLRYEAAMYQPTTLVWGATGRGILAFLPEDVIDAVLAKEEPSPATGRKMGKAIQIKSELAKVRDQGYVHSSGQKVVGAEGFAAPVFDSAGVIGALCITLPKSRFKESMQPRIVRSLVDQAARFSSTLGHRDVATSRPKTAKH